MDLDKNLSDMSTLSILVASIGIVDDEFISKQTSLLNNNASKVNLLPFWQNDLKEKAKNLMPQRVITIKYKYKLTNHRIGMRVIFIAGIQPLQSLLNGVNSRIISNMTRITPFY